VRPRDGRDLDHQLRLEAGFTGRTRVAAGWGTEKL